MRTFYIFLMKEEFISLYKNSPKVLFQILRQIYYLHIDEVHYGFNLFKQLIMTINKEELDMFIFLKFHQEYSYVKRSGVHIINDLYKDEVSRLLVKKTHIKIESDSFPYTFLTTLGNFSATFFVCDFEKQDYFFLDKNEVFIIK